jgi:hypothetical protein
MKKALERIADCVATIFKITARFALAGFIVPWCLLVFYGIANHMGIHPTTTPLILLCPTSIAALGLDDASLLIGILGWVAIAISNALLYAVIGTVLAIPFAMAKRAPVQHQALGLNVSSSVSEVQIDRDASARH